jgi:hypothetical protein
MRLAQRLDSRQQRLHCSLQFRTQPLRFLRIHIAHVAPAQPFPIALGQSAGRVHQRLPRSHQSGSCPNHCQIRLCLRAAMLHRTQQLWIDPGQPRQGLRVQTIVFLPALPDQPHAACMCHDHFVPQPAQHSAHPRRMHPRLQRDPAARHASEHLLHSFRGRTQSLFQHYFAALIQHAVPT